LTRHQIQTLMASRKQAADAAPESPSHTALAVGGDAAAEAMEFAGPANGQEPVGNERPVVPPAAEEQFAPIAGPLDTGDRLIYRPTLLAVARLHFVRATYGKVDVWRTLAFLRQVRGDQLDDVWKDAVELAGVEFDLEDAPSDEVPFAELPADLANARNYGKWKRELKDWAYREKTLIVRYCEALKEYSKPEEAEDDFRIRLTQIAHEQRDLAVEKLRQRYATKFATLKGQIRRAEERVGREEAQYKEKRFESAISFGTTVLGALFGRKLTSLTNISKAGTAVRSAGKTLSEHGDIARAKEELESLRGRFDELETELKTEIEEAESHHRPDELVLEELPIRPRKTDLEVQQVALVWLPWRIDSDGIGAPAYSGLEEVGTRSGKPK
jgi:hypothetical protein